MVKWAFTMQRGEVVGATLGRSTEGPCLALARSGRASRKPALNRSLSPQHWGGSQAARQMLSGIFAYGLYVFYLVTLNWLSDHGRKLGGRYDR